MKARSKNWLEARTGGRLKIAEREKRRFDKCTQVCYIAKIARNVKSQIIN